MLLDLVVVDNIFCVRSPGSPRARQILFLVALRYFFFEICGGYKREQDQKNREFIFIK